MILWLSSYPKSGNTWVRSLIANYINYNVSDKWKVFARNDIVEEVGGDSEHTAYVGAVWKANDKLYISPNILINDRGEDVRLTCMFSY